MTNCAYQIDGDPVSSRAGLPASVVAGMWWGAAIWGAYGFTEYFFFAALPLFSLPLAVFAPVHLRFDGLLMVIYCIVGALAGAVAGFLMRNWGRGATPTRDDRRRSGRLYGTLGLLLAVQVNLYFAAPLNRSGDLTFAIALAGTVAIFWALGHPDSRVMGVIKFNPFLLALLLIAPPWLNANVLEDHGLMTRTLGGVVALVAIYGANGLLRRSQPWSAGRHLLTGIAMFVVLALACNVQSARHAATPVPLSPPAGPDPGRPPVVLVVIDTARADHTSLSGYRRNTTPNLAKFAEGATVYTNAVAVANFTLPTHASIFTGVYPSWHGAIRIGESLECRPLGDDLPTLAGVLSAKGYATAAVAANSVYLLPEFGLMRGFQRYAMQNGVPPVEPRVRYRYILRMGVGNLLAKILPAAGFVQRYRRGLEINADAGALLASRSVRERSFFLFANYMDAHEPYVPPAPYDTLFLDGRPRLSYARALDMMKGGRPSQDERERWMAQYDGGLAYADFALNQLLERLKAWGIYDKAMIIVSADHGESFGAHGVWAHGDSVYGSEINVPLVIKYPGQKTRAVVDVPVSQVDLLPTVLDTLGYGTEMPAHLQGHSLRHPENLNGRDLLTEAFQGSAVRSGGLKLIVSTEGKRELYDIGQDPAERNNLYSPRNAAVQLTDSAYRRWMRLIARISAPARPRASQQELRRLKSLGYVQ